jgi:HEAT repeat protein
MGQHGSDLAYRYLAQFVDNGTEPSQSRPAAVSALGNSVYWIESAKKWVVSKLEALLRDPEYNVRYAAIGALGALKSKDSVSAIEAVAASAIANQDQPYVQRNILKIKTSREDASQHEKQARFAEEIELLKSEIATLSAKFDMMTS